MPLSTPPTISTAISSRGQRSGYSEPTRRTNGKTQSRQHDRAVLLLSLFRSRHLNLTTPFGPMQAHLKQQLWFCRRAVRWPPLEGWPRSVSGFANHPNSTLLCPASLQAIEGRPLPSALLTLPPPEPPPHPLVPIPPATPLRLRLFS